MSRYVIAIAGLLLLGAPAGAAAKDTDARVQAIIACQSIAQDQARLQCYDHALVVVKQALEEGRVVVREIEVPTALEGVVKASGSNGEKRYWVEFANGDRWALETRSIRDEPPRPGTTLRLRKGPLRNYWASGAGWRESRAEFIGHGS